MYTFTPNTVSESSKVNSNFTGLANGTEISDAVILSRHVGADLASGWLPLGDVPDTVTNNGNGNYDLVFNSNDLTDTVSEGMNLRTTRTVSAPTQCADLESGSSQYFSSASAGLNGMTFTDDFTTMGWIKLESYAAMTIIGRWNGTNGWYMDVTATGILRLVGFNAGAFDNVQSYTSVPLGEWIHVAAHIDMSGATGKVYFNGLEVTSSYTSGAPTAIVQAGDLQVGACNTTQYFDGKIAQVAVFSSILSAATIRSYMSQGLTGSESTLVSAYSCSNSLLDLNTTNNNDLTANGGALMTNADSPSGNQSDGTISATLDYATVTKTAFSTNSTISVQVPKGCTIPTSGGVSAVSYSTAKSPYKMPNPSNVIGDVLLQNSFSTATTGSFVDASGMSITVFVPQNKRLRISCVGAISNSTASYTAVAIREGSTVLGQVVTTATAEVPFTVVAETYPSVGSHTYVLSVAANGGTTVLQGGVGGYGVRSPILFKAEVVEL